MGGMTDDARALVVVDAAELEALVQRAVRRALDERPAEPAEWLDTAAAADLLDVHPRTVTRLARSGELASSRVGKLWRFRRADVLAYLESGAA